MIGLGAGLIGELITGGVGLVKDWLSDKREQKKQDRQVQTEIKKKQIENIRQGNLSATELDAISIRTRGWKDEYLMLAITIPMILCFIPGGKEYAYAGFDALSKVPDYYWYGLAGVYIDTFGFRRLLRPVLAAKVAQLQYQIGGKDG
ncbi:hypothetical protein [Vibrio coralliilyticus]|uniref:hypothetical protein n=1 Tax=Vibrio coralliilyticus TaxID=190893 RepID=UPI001F5BBA53|nr:hypothetical protein [Vibrio coralliilyticus]